MRFGILPDVLCEQMTSRDLTEWIAFDRVSPVGDERGDVQAALVAQVIANAHRTKGRAFELGDFMLRWRPVQESPRSMFERMKAALIPYGAK